MKTSTASLLLAAVLLAACGGSPYRVRSAVERDADYFRYTTFGLSTETLALEGAPEPERVEAAAARVRERLVAQMTARGYEQAPVEEADLVLEFAIVGQVRSAAIPTSAFGSAPENLDIVDGGLVVWVGERVSDSLLWTGYIEGEWYADGRDRSEEAVGLLMAEFPGRR